MTSEGRVGSGGQRLEGRREEGDDGEERERGEHTHHERPEQPDGHAARLQLGGTTTIEAQLEAGPLQGVDERHAVAEVVDEHLGQRAGAVAERRQVVKQGVSTRPARGGGDVSGQEGRPDRRRSEPSDELVRGRKRHAGGAGQGEEVDHLGERAPHRRGVGCACSPIHDASTRPPGDDDEQRQGRRHEVQAEVHALATQARTSAGLLAVAPLAFAGLVATIEPGAVAFLITSPVGVACLLLGVGLDAVGATWMRRITGSHR